MPKFIVSKEWFEEHQHSKALIPLTRILTDDEADEIRGRFNDYPKGFEFQVSNLNDFKNFVQLLPEGGKSKGIAVRYGRSGDGEPLNIALEAVQYKRSSSGSIIEYSFYPPEQFCGRSSEDGFVKAWQPSERNDFNKIIEIPDYAGKQFALISFKTFSRLIDKSSLFTFLQIEFGRNEKMELTVILSRWHTDVPIASELDGVIGIYADDNDLLP